VKVFRLGLGNGLRLSVAALTDVGIVRQNNEDSLGVYPEPAEGQGHLLVVADGMGGAAAGEVASRLAIETLPEVLRSAPPGEAPDESLGRALATANHRVLDESLTDKEKRGMGTTCTAVLVRGGALHLAHIGDSRAYRMDGDDLRQLTLDHTLGAELERTQTVGSPPAPPESHNILTRCIGVDARLQADYLEEPLPAPGGLLLLCSDGLTGVVSDDTLARLLLEGDPPDICRALVDEAKEGGAPDNVSVIVARVDRD
jgi:protein phosphatase